MPRESNTPRGEVEIHGRVLEEGKARTARLEEGFREKSEPAAMFHCQADDSNGELLPTLASSHRNIIDAQHQTL